jgi:hypothetical protein
LQARNDVAGRHGLNDQDVGHDGEDIVMRGERCKPVDGEIMDPDDEYGKVDGEDPEHEYE